MRPVSIYGILAAACLPYGSLGKDYNQEACNSALMEAYSSVTFAGPGEGDYYATFCLNTLKMSSVFAAKMVYCRSTTGMIIDSARAFCKVTKLDEQAEPFIQKTVKQVDDGFIKKLPVVKYGQYTAADNITHPFLVDRPWFELVYRTAWDFQYETWRHTTNGWAAMGFWGIILVLGSLRNAINMLSLRQNARRADPETQSVVDSKTATRIPRAFKQIRYWCNLHIIVPSIFGDYHRRTLLGCTIPTRLEALVVYSFWLLNFLLCVVDYRGFEGNLYWPEVSQQTWRYIADRTGIVSFANLPLLWLFSGRNNVFLWSTGWSFTTFNLFHRHIARIATLQAIIHSIAYTVFYLGNEDGFASFSSDFKVPWFYLGVVATITMSLIVGFSSVWFRKHTYETFLIIHIGLSVATIVGLFYHIEIFEGVYEPYLWPLVAIWSFERGVRLIRIVYCNLYVQLGRGRSIHGARSLVHYEETANVLRIKIAVDKSLMKPGPGQYFYIYQPFGLKGWENHPFTLAYWDAPDPDNPNPEPLALRGNPSSSESPNDNSSEQGRNMIAHPRQQGKRADGYEFWARPLDGWTKNLRKSCVRSPNHQFSPVLLIEGPYGHTVPLWKHDIVLLVAGGSGVSAAAPYLLCYTRNGQGNTSPTRQVDFIWANPDESYIRNMASRELGPSLRHQNVRAFLHVTRAEKPGNTSGYEVKTISSRHQPLDKETPVCQKTTGSTSDISTEQPGGLNLHYGRPDLRSYVTAAATEAVQSNCSLAVFICGPSSMTDGCRAAVRDVMREIKVDIEYFEDVFGW